MSVNTPYDCSIKRGGVCCPRGVSLRRFTRRTSIQPSPSASKKVAPNLGSPEIFLPNLPRYDELNPGLSSHIGNCTLLAGGGATAIPVHATSATPPP